MPEHTHVHVTTTNQPRRLRIEVRELAELLGWNPEGAPIAQLADTLRGGVGVSVFTRRVPTARGTAGVAYRLLPCSADWPTNRVPNVARIVEHGGAPTE